MAFCGLDKLLEGVERLGTLHELGVDQHARGALDTQLGSHLRIRLDDIFVLIGIQTLVELGRIQFQVCGKSFELVLGKGPLILAALAREQLVVIFPELALLIRTLARFGGP